MYPALVEDREESQKAAERAIITDSWILGIRPKKAKTKYGEKIRTSMNTRPPTPKSTRENDESIEDTLSDHFLTRMAVFMLFHIASQ